MHLGPSELALEGEAGFGPAVMGKTDPPRSGGPRKDIKADASDREDSRFLELRLCEGKDVWEGKEGVMEDTWKTDLIL